MIPTNSPTMPLIFIALLLLPFRLTGQGLKGLAFVLWLLGGLILCMRGITFLTSMSPEITLTSLIITILVSFFVGYGKGKFVLSKTSQKNIDRLNTITTPQRLLAVYSLRSWIMIALMVGIAVSLNLFNVSGMWRGGVNLAVGIALIISSLAYIPALKTSTNSKNA